MASGAAALTVRRSVSTPARRSDGRSARYASTVAGPAMGHSFDAAGVASIIAWAARAARLKGAARGNSRTLPMRPDA